MENVVKDATITVRIPRELKEWAQAPGTLGGRSLSGTVCCALEKVRAREENGADTPEAPRKASAWSFQNRIEPPSNGGGKRLVVPIDETSTTCCWATAPGLVPEASADT